LFDVLFPPYNCLAVRQSQTEKIEPTIKYGNPMSNNISPSNIDKFASGNYCKPIVLGIEVQSGEEDDGIIGFGRGDTPGLYIASSKESLSSGEITLSHEARWLGNYIIGIQGMGKSNLLKQIALTDINNHEGVCVISPHPDLTQDILMRIPDDRWDDVVVFDPSDDCPVGMNIFEWSGPESRISIDKIADDVVTKTFQLIWADSWGPRMEEMMANVSRTILYSQSLPPEKRPTLAEFELIIGRGKDTSYRDALMKHIHSTYNSRGIDLLERYWVWFDDQDHRFREQIASSTLNKARPFAANELIAHVVGQGVNKVDFREIMDEGKILLVDLNVDKLGSGNVELMGSLLVGRLFLAALSRETDPPPPRFHIIADEFGYFATPAFAALQDQARKFGVDVLVAHQRRGQLDLETKDATRSARNWVVFNVNPEDARELSEAFDSTPPPPPLVPVERQKLIYHSNPWNDIKDNGHEKIEVMDVFEGTLDLLYNKSGMDMKFISHELNLSIITLAEHTSNDNIWVQMNHKLGSYTSRPSHRIRIEKSLGADYEQENRNFEKHVNRYLYSMMTGKSKKTINDNLLFFCSYIFPKITLEKCIALVIPEEIRLRYESGQTSGNKYWEYEIINKCMEVEDNGKSELELIKECFNKVQSVLEEIKSHQNRNQKQLENYKFRFIDKLIIAYANVYFRNLVVERIKKLSNLLREYPIWVRGGQPIVEYEKPPPRTEITLEWKNRFAHLPRYEAWCRIQEGREINEYHIQTIEISPTPSNGFERAEQIRAISRKNYGTPRDDIEEEMAARLENDNEGNVETVEKL